MFGRSRGGTLSVDTCDQHPHWVITLAAQFLANPQKYHWFYSVMLIPKLHMNKLCIMQTFWAKQHIAYRFSAQTYNHYI